MLYVRLFIFALAIFKLANAEDYDYDELVSEEPIQVIFDKIDASFILLNQNMTTDCHPSDTLYVKLSQKQFDVQNV